MGRFLNLLGSLETTFKIGKGKLTATGLTAARTYTLPDRDGRFATDDSQVFYEPGTTTQVTINADAGQLAALAFADDTEGDVWLVEKDTSNNLRVRYYEPTVHSPQTLLQADRTTGVLDLGTVPTVGGTPLTLQSDGIYTSDTAPDPAEHPWWRDSTTGIVYRWYVGASSSAWVADATGAGYGGAEERTDFPTSPAINQRVHRLDLHMTAFWDGTHWLSEQVFEAGGVTSSSAMTGLASTAAVAARIPVRNDYPIYLTKLCASTFINGASSGSSFWVMGVEFYTAGNTTSNVASFSTGTTPDTGSNWTSHVLNINAPLNSTARELVVSLTKTASPGAIFWATSLYYRLILG